MHAQVETNGNPRNRRSTNQLGVAEQGGCTVVVAMKKSYHKIWSVGFHWRAMTFETPKKEKKKKERNHPITH